MFSARFGVFVSLLKSGAGRTPVTGTGMTHAMVTSHSSWQHRICTVFQNNTNHSLPIYNILLSSTNSSRYSAGNFHLIPSAHLSTQLQTSCILRTGRNVRAVSIADLLQSFSAAGLESGTLKHNL